jgi:beta-lactam-binding protein with PASTA domain
VRTCRSCGRQNPDDQDFCVCGEYLRWEPTTVLPSASSAASTARAPPEPPPPRPGPAAAGDAGQATPAPDSVSLTLRLPGDQLADTLETVRLTVAPGGRAVLLALVRNQSAIVDNYDLSLVGLPDGWWSIVPATVYLVPFGAGGTYEQEVEIHLHPPRMSQAQARTWSFDVLVWSRAHQTRAAAAPASVDIAPYQELRTALTPDRAKGRRQARFTFAAEVELSALDADGECTFHFAQPTVGIAPGERVEVPLVARPPRQIWIGRARDRQFEVTARPREGDMPLPPQSGIFHQRSWLPWWLVVVGPVLAAIAVAALLLIPKKVTVPDLTKASSRFAAEQALTKARLNPVPNVETVTGGGTPGAIVAQTPTAGSKVKVGTKVTIQMVVGSSQVQVPSVVGKKVQEAASALDAAGLKLGEMLPPPADPQATIESQIPAAGKKARQGDAVMVFVVHAAAQGQGTNGATAEGAAGGAKIAVPQVAGQTLQAAAASLAAAGLLPTEVPRVDAAPAGTLLRSVPATGERAPRGGKVQLIVSAGFPPLIFDTNDGLMLVTGATTAAAPLPGTNRGDDEATWSADGTHIAYRSGSDLLLAKPGQSATPLVKAGAAEAFHNPAFAPQGHVLAFVRRTSGGSAICFVDVQATVGPPDCVNDPGKVIGRSVSWSYDGGQIVAAGQAKGHPNKFGLVLYRSSKPFSSTAADWGKGTFATDTRRLNVGALAGAFSPDGKRLAVAANFGGSFQLYLTKTADVSLRQAKQLPVPACQVAWAPDSAEVVVTQTPNCASDARGTLIRVDPADPSKAITVAPVGGHPTWQPLPPVK